jgi:hypothetical protein
MTLTMTKDMRIGVQIVIDGEKIEVEQFLTLLTLFLEYAIPALTTLQHVGLILMAIIGGIYDGYTVLTDLISTMGDLPGHLLTLTYCGLLLGVAKYEAQMGIDNTWTGNLYNLRSVHR